MGTVHLVEPPEYDGNPCFMCLMAAKQHQWDLYNEPIEAGLAKPDSEVTWIPWPAKPPVIREGSWRGVPGDAPELGVCEGLCWDHLAGYKPVRVSTLADGKGVPPGLLRGRG